MRLSNDAGNDVSAMATGSCSVHGFAACLHHGWAIIRVPWTSGYVMRATARARPNIALIKYWGKSDPDRNLPAVGSISATLDGLYTSMDVEIDGNLPQDDLLVDGMPQPSMLARVSRCLDDVLGADRPPARISSRCNFPIAAGLASSASAFAALVVAANAAGGGACSTAELAQTAGRASGSAARSLYGGYVELDICGQAIAVRPLCAPAEWPLRVVIAVTETGSKSIGSTEAMEISRKTSPFYRLWVEQQADDLAVARDAIANRDFMALAAVAEHNCLKMHSVMWASRPPVSYWNSATLDCMQTVRELQADGVQAFFTIDAGPQVKVFCEPQAADRVRQALSEIGGVHNVMECGIGTAAEIVTDA